MKGEVVYINQQRGMVAGLYGDVSGKPNRQIIQRSMAAQATRATKHALTVHFFDAETADVWGET